jgi:predicted ATPase with chaperone activity
MNDAIHWTELRGQEQIKRVLEVAAAGGNTVLVTCVGCPGDDALVGAAAAALGVEARTIWPCPCGNHGSPDRTCTCSPELIVRHRVETLGESQYDLYVEMPAASFERITSARKVDTLDEVKARAGRARKLLGAGRTHLGELLPLLDAAGLSLLKAAHRQLAMSQSQITRTLRTARAIAALGGSERIGAAHLAEAVQYRPRPA